MRSLKMSSRSQDVGCRLSPTEVLLGRSECTTADQQQLGATLLGASHDSALLLPAMPAPWLANPASSCAMG